MLDFSVGSRMVLDSIGARRGSCSPGSTLPAPTLPGSTSPAHPGSSSPGSTLPAPTLPGSTSPGSSLPTDGDETACARLDWWTDRHGLGIANDAPTCYMNAPAVQMPCRRGPSSWAARAGDTPNFSAPRPSECLCAHRVGRRLIWRCSCCCVCDVERGTRHCRPMAMVLAHSCSSCASC